MTRFTVVVLPDAEAELREAFLWYFDKSPLAADAFGTEVDNAIDGLEETAADWPIDEHGVHFYHLKRFPYTLRYEIAGSETPCTELLGDRTSVSINLLYRCIPKRPQHTVDAGLVARTLSLEPL